jgi:hypothetical protein
VTKIAGSATRFVGGGDSTLGVAAPAAPTNLQNEIWCDLRRFAVEEFQKLHAEIRQHVIFGRRCSSVLVEPTATEMIDLVDIDIGGFSTCSHSLTKPPRSERPEHNKWVAVRRNNENSNGGAHFMRDFGPIVRIPRSRLSTPADLPGTTI